AFHHGYTRDYVAGLGVVWDSGQSSLVHGPWSTAQNLSPVSNATVTEPESRRAERNTAQTNEQGPWTNDGDSRRDAILREVTELLKANAERIAITRTRTPFDRCGYQLHGVLGSAGVDLAKLLVGSEGTLAVIT